MFFGPRHYARSVAKGEGELQYGEGSKRELVPQRDRNSVVKEILKFPYRDHTQILAKENLLFMHHADLDGEWRKHFVIIECIRKTLCSLHGTETKRAVMGNANSCFRTKKKAKDDNEDVGVSKLLVR